MRPLLTLLATALLGLAATACGSTGKTTGSISPASSGAAAARMPSSTTPVRSRPYVDGDGASDDSASNRHDEDDDAVLSFGHAAGAADKQAVTALVKRYYAVAAAGDGATACSLIRLAAAKAVPQDYGQPPGPPALRGKTCAVVMSKLLRQRHRELAVDIATLEVTGVRVRGSQAIALLSSSAMPIGDIYLQREGGAWKINELLGGGLG
jgi:hypothetical protein